MGLAMSGASLSVLMIRSLFGTDAGHYLLFNDSCKVDGFVDDFDPFVG